MIGVIEIENISIFHPNFDFNLRFPLAIAIDNLARFFLSMNQKRLRRLEPYAANR